MLDLNVLQFCDFFNALLSIWVTLIAMASMGSRATSFCHMIGIIIIAFGVEKERTSLWVFLLPAIAGCLIVMLSWAYKCRQKGELQIIGRFLKKVFFFMHLQLVLA